MSKLQQIEREIEQHIQRPNHCAACLKSITDVTAPACDVLVELQRQAREVKERRERYAAYKKTMIRKADASSYFAPDRLLSPNFFV